MSLKLLHHTSNNHCMGNPAIILHKNLIHLEFCFLSVQKQVGVSKIVLLWMLHNGPLSIYMNRVVYWLGHISFWPLGSPFARITPSNTKCEPNVSVMCNQYENMKIITQKLHFLCFIYLKFVVKSVFHIICYSNTLRININVTVLNYKHLLSPYKLIMCEIHMAQPYFKSNPTHIK